MRGIGHNPINLTQPAWISSIIRKLSPDIKAHDFNPGHIGHLNSPVGSAYIYVHASLSSPTLENASDAGSDRDKWVAAITTLRNAVQCAVVDHTLGSDEVMFGRAGLLWAMLNLNIWVKSPELPPQKLADLSSIINKTSMEGIIKRILEAGKAGAQLYKQEQWTTFDVGVAQLELSWIVCRFNSNLMIRLLTLLAGSIESFFPTACLLFFCRGASVRSSSNHPVHLLNLYMCLFLQIADNVENTRVLKAGDVLNIKVELEARHTGIAVSSIWNSLRQGSSDFNLPIERFHCSTLSDLSSLEDSDKGTRTSLGGQPRISDNDGADVI